MQQYFGNIKKGILWMYTISHSRNTSFLSPSGMLKISIFKFQTGINLNFPYACEVSTVNLSRNVVEI